MNIAENAKPVLTVAVAIPTYLREDGLVIALGYVAARSGADVELLVVDQTLAHEPATECALRHICQTRNVRWIRTPKPSLTGARNIVLASTGAIDFSEALRKHGMPYCEFFTYANDYEYFSRVALRCRTANLPEALLDYRSHDGAMGIEGAVAEEAAAALVGERELRRLFRGDPPVPAPWSRAIGQQRPDVLTVRALRPAVIAFLATRDAFLREPGIRCGLCRDARREIYRHVQGSISAVVLTAANAGADTAAIPMLVGSRCPTVLVLALTRPALSAARRARERVVGTMRGLLDASVQRRARRRP